MSAFFKLPFDMAGKLPEAIQRNEPSGAELASGVLLARRDFLWQAGVAATLMPSCAAAALPKVARRPEEAPLPGRDWSFEEFVTRTRPLANALLQSHEPNEESYLHQVAAHLQRVKAFPSARFKWGGKVRMDTSYYFQPLIVFQIKMAPGSRLELHDHRDYNGVLLGWEGECRVRSFEPLDAAAAREARTAFKIRETGRQVLTRGRCSMLSRLQNNYHEIVAGPDGAWLVDVFTYFSLDAESRTLSLRDQPLPERKDIYEAAWKESN